QGQAAGAGEPARGVSRIAVDDLRPGHGVAAAEPARHVEAARALTERVRPGEVGLVRDEGLSEAVQRQGAGDDRDRVDLGAGLLDRAAVQIEHLVVRAAGHGSPSSAFVAHPACGRARGAMSVTGPSWAAEALSPCALSQASSKIELA